jgi:hypothetical protein
MKIALRMAIIITLATLLPMMSANAQEAGTTNMDILAQKVKADKKLVVAMNLNLDDAESKAFWPIYDSYQADLENVNQRLGKLISDYADAYNSGSVSNEIAAKLITEWIHLEAEEMKLRVENVKKLAQAVPAKKVAQYLQIENKIRALIRFGLAANVPLVY